MQKLTEKKWIIIAISISLLIATFYDLQLSILLYDPKSIIGKLFENHMLTIVFLPVIYSCIAIFKVKKNYLSLIFALILSVYCAYMNLHGYIQNKVYFILLSLFVGICLLMMMFGVVKKQVSFKHYETIFVFLLIVIVIHFIKVIDGRIRFRDFSDFAAYSQFTNWYDFNFLKPGNSFPSGHTATMYVLLPILSIFKYDGKHYRYITYTTIFLMAFSRINYGAHFLSDTMIALLIAITLETLWNKKGRKYFERKITGV